MSLWDNRNPLSVGLTRLGQAAKRLMGAGAITAREIPACTVEMEPDHPVQAPGIYCQRGQFQGYFFYFSCQSQKIVIGRDCSCCNLVFPSQARGISARHCELIWDPRSQTVVCRDLGSTYGILLFDKRCLSAGEMAVLRDGEGFSIGEGNSFVLRLPKGGEQA